MEKPNGVEPRVIWVLALAVIVIVAALFLMVTPVAWATPPQDRAHQTVPVGVATCVIGPDGGSCADADDHDFVFTVPPGALTQTCTFRIRVPAVGEMHPPDSGFAVAAPNDVYIVECLDASGNVVTPLNFSPPATVCINYTADELATAGGDPHNLRILFFNITTGHWEQLTPLTVDTANQKICAPVTHLTLFALFGKRPVTLPVTGAELDNTQVLTGLMLLALSLGLAWFVLNRRAHA